MDSGKWRAKLLDFFVRRVLVAMGAELLQFQPCSGVATVFLSGVAGNPSGTLVGVGTALGTFQRDNDSDALSHDFILYS